MDTDSDGALERPGPAEPYVHAQLTELIIGAAFEVHNTLGPGFLEDVYEKALVHELKSRGLPVEQQPPIHVLYKGHTVGNYVPDLLVGREVICEIKATASLAPIHETQLLNYLKAPGIRIGLLLNFETTRLQIKRLIL